MYFCPVYRNLSGVKKKLALDTVQRRQTPECDFFLFRVGQGQGNVLHLIQKS